MLDDLKFRIDEDFGAASIFAAQQIGRSTEDYDPVAVGYDCSLGKVRSGFPDTVEVVDVRIDVLDPDLPKRSLSGTKVW